MLYSNWSSSDMSLILSLFVFSGLLASYFNSQSLSFLIHIMRIIIPTLEDEE